MAQLKVLLKWAQAHPALAAAVIAAGGSVLLLVLTGVGYLVKWRHEAPSAIVGYVADPPGFVHVTLDNGPRKADADRIKGLFRFDAVVRGLHILRFEYPHFQPVSVEVSVQSPGDNFLRERVRLERAVAGVGELHTGNLRIETIAVSTNSADGGLPRVPAAVVRNLAAVVGSPQSSQSGWIYIGSFEGGEWKHQAVDVGPTLPVTGANLVAGSGVLMWSKEPEQRFFQGYNVGRVTAVVQPGDTLKIRELRTDVGKDNVWALVNVGVSRDQQKVVPKP